MFKTTQRDEDEQVIPVPTQKRLEEICRPYLRKLKDIKYAKTIKDASLVLHQNESTSSLKNDGH